MATQPAVSDILRVSTHHNVATKNYDSAVTRDAIVHTGKTKCDIEMSYRDARTHLITIKTSNSYFKLNFLYLNLFLYLLHTNLKKLIY